MNLEQVVSVRAAKTIYRDGDNVIKVFNEDFSKADVLNEALNQARVEETALNIPKVREVLKIDGKWAIVSDFIEGKTLTELMEENPDREDAYLDLFVNIQLEIFAQKCPMLNRLTDKMNRKIAQTDLDATTRYELHMRLESMKKHDKVCHGDFSTSNVIITPAGEHYIIDWSHVTQGNAAADVARAFLLFHLKGQPELAEKYINLYCKKSDTAKQYVQKWLPIVAASQSVKRRPEEHDFLLRWVDVVDYE